MSRAHTSAQHDPLHAAWLMLLATLLFGGMAVAIRLASQTLHTFEVAFFRNFFGLLAALPLLLRHGKSLLQPQRLPKYLVRCTIGVVSMLAGFWAIAHLPLAQAVALSYSSPIFVILAAVLFLGERVRARRWTAVLIGFFGVLLIVRPGTEGFHTGSLIAVLSAVLNGVVAIQIKQLAETEPADRIVFWTTLLWVPMSLLPALFVWQWPSGIAWLWAIGAGVFGTGGHMLWTRALKLGEVTALTPITFMQLPIVAAAGWWLFAESPSAWTWIGAGVILAANAYIAHREAVLVRRSATRAAVEAAPPGE